MRKLFLLGTAREASTRLRKKMVRPFAGTTLFDIYMKKFEVLKDCKLFCGIGMAVPTSDKELWVIAAKYDVPMIEEIPRENPAPIARNKELYYLKDIDATHIMWVNGCLPMLKVHTICDLAWEFLANHHYQSLEPVLSRKQHFWKLATGEPLNQHATSLQHTEAVGESCQALHIFNREVMIRTSRYFEGGKQNDPFIRIVQENRQVHDIDTAEQFQKIQEEFGWCDQGMLYDIPAHYAHNRS